MKAVLVEFAARAARSAVAWSMVSVAMRVVSAILVLPIMLRTIPPEQLGLWYVFLSLGALAGMIDFGFSPSIIRSVAYAWAGARKILPLGLHEDEHEKPESTGPNTELLVRLIATARMFYSVTALASGFLLLTAGSWWIWGKTAPLDHAFSLRLAWVVWCVGGILNGLGNVWPPLLAGINAVRESERISALVLVVNSTLTVIGLLLGWGIWALVLANFIMGMASRILGKRAFYRHGGAILGATPAHLDWEMIRTLWPMSWRGGVVSMGSYLILQANTLVCTQYLGLVVTASYGLSLQVVGLLTYVSQVWINVKMPLIYQLRAQRKLHEIAVIFTARMRLAILIYIIGSLAILWLGTEVLTLIHAKTTLLPEAIMAFLLFVYLLELNGAAHAGLIQTENVNPFVFPVLLTGIAVFFLSNILTFNFGALGIPLAYFLAQSCFNTWWPLKRAVQGLNMTHAEYWKIFFLQRKLY